MTGWLRSNGVGLAHGEEGSGPRVVLVHGFTQTGVSWQPVADLLVADHEVVRVDAPGHGGSASVRADLSEGARLLGEVGGRATYVGYSMGGRLALRLALDRPDLIDGLVLIGATAGIDRPVERITRRATDEVLAASLEMSGVDAFLERWLAEPLFAGFSPTAADLAARRTNSAAGLAWSLRLAGTGTMDPPWWGELPRIGAPTMVLAGERDPKFSAIGRRLADAIGPNAHFDQVPAAGHAAHLEQPVWVANAIRSGSALRGRAIGDGVS